MQAFDSVLKNGFESTLSVEEKRMSDSGSGSGSDSGSENYNASLFLEPAAAADSGDQVGALAAAAVEVCMRGGGGSVHAWCVGVGE